MKTTNKPTQKKSAKRSALKSGSEIFGNSGELHQYAGGTHPVLTTQQGHPIADDENSLRVSDGRRPGPGLLEDFVLREKIQHFDHERIPERIVHARGAAAHGFFELTDSLKKFTRARVLSKTGERVPVFVRFSTVAGNAGSADLARDVRGFAVKMYTQEGNWDLVGNNIPVFFIQDAIKFPDLIHAVKQEPDRGFPQAASAHDTFWDFVSLTPESTHMLMWVMSDRAIPRSYRNLEGFGVHTFRLLNEAGDTTFVKFHWRPKLGLQSVIWDEALKINGGDPDYHRRDLWNAINEGSFPEWELGVQLFDQKFADKFEFDVLDPTKLIPEEQIPLRIIGRMVLDRNPVNYFSETEQVAFMTQNVPPGIDFSNDPLLAGRNFSYLDTQLTRLGTPNFAEIPINAPKCPFANMQRDGHMRMNLQPGRVSYSPSSLESDTPRATPAGITAAREPVAGDKLRIRPELFADHFSQALQFFNSQTGPEQDHIISAFIFELSKVETVAVRQRMVSQLANVDMAIAKRVADGLGMKGAIVPAPTSVTARKDLPLSPALSILRKAKKSLAGKLVGCLIADGTDKKVVAALKKLITAAGADMKVIAPKIGGATAADGSVIAADFQLAGGPSVLFDCVFLALSSEGAATLATEAAAVAFVHDAFQHLKVIGATSEAQRLLDKAGVVSDHGIVIVKSGTAPDVFTKRAAGGRIWDREPTLRTTY